MAAYYPIGWTIISLTNPQAPIVRARLCFKSFPVIENDVILEMSTTLS